MKHTYMIEFELPEVMNEEFMALIPQQRYMINQMLAEGTIKSYSLSMDRLKLWVILSANSEFEAMEIIDTFPLCDFMTPHLTELMFHNSADMLMQFSLN
ncbi:MAG: muconolactone Delta-isomerase family protein [Saprospiraceae bacterium]